MGKTNSDDIMKRQTTNHRHKWRCLLFYVCKFFGFFSSLSNILSFLSSRPLFVYPSLVSLCCLFDHWVVSPFVHCHCAWLNTTTEFKQWLTTNKMTFGWCCCCLLSLNQFFFLIRAWDFIVEFVVYMQQYSWCYIAKQICHIFILHCDWLRRLNQWQNSIFNGDYELQ